MTRSERIQAAIRAFADGATVPAVLDAALADLGGLDGLDRTLAHHDRMCEVVGECAVEGDAAIAERDALRADRDRLRRALRMIALSTPGSINGRQAERALADSEAGT